METSQIKKNFEENGYIILKNFISNNGFNEMCENLKRDIFTEFNRSDESKIGGSLMGNLNIYTRSYGKKFYDQLINNNIDNIIKIFSNKNLVDFDIYAGGNLNFQYKYNQHFHTDGNFKNNYLIINIATEDINELNGPLEISPGTHKKQLPYWKFIFYKKKKFFYLREIF